MLQEALQWAGSDSTFRNPLPLTEVARDLHRYSAILVPGGQGVMVDLAQDPLVPILLRHFAEHRKPTGLICHAPSLLLTLPAQDHPYKGYTVNAVSPFEEWVIERFIMKGKPTNRKIGRQLRKAGFRYKRDMPKANYAVKGRNLVTSQNPYSGAAFNRLFLQAMNEYTQRRQNH